MTESNRLCQAALAVLMVLQLVMLGALFTGTPPHPPLKIPLFALAPFLGASLAIALAASLLGANDSRFGCAASVLAALLALVSFGPQKWVHPDIGGIWPAVLLGEAASLVVLVAAVRSLRAGRAAISDPAAPAG